VNIKTDLLFLMDKDSILDFFVKNEGLTSVYRDRAERYFIPLAEQMLDWKGSEVLCLGMNGAQGSGKSTLSRFLQMYFRELHGLSMVILSLDDLYLTRAERIDLAKEVHPLLETRGVPGTHDIGLGIDFMERCLEGDWKQAICPRFNKATDDREPLSHWQRLEEAPDIILLEGWCVGALPEPEEALSEPVNMLEKEEDAAGTWRRFVNERLGSEYQSFYDMFSHWVVLQPPSFEAVVENRMKQEEQLRAQVQASDSVGLMVMSDEDVIRFVSHYERLTRWMWTVFPERADVLIRLKENHVVNEMVIR
jgi:D-glycerate 3-kinase